MFRTAKQGDLLCEFFTELARYLVQAGISASDLQSQIQRGYVRAATKHAKLRNKRVNQSAVAAITGMTRPQVRALIKEQSQDSRRHGGPVEGLVNAWMTEPEFSLDDGSPRLLALRGRRGSFADLAKRFGGDIPPRALLAELSRRKLVKVQNEKVSLCGSCQGSESVNRRLDKLLGVLAMAIRSPSEDADAKSLKANYAELVFPSLSPTAQVLLRRRIKQSVNALSADLESAVAALAKEAPLRSKKNARHTSKLSVVIVSQE